MSFPSFHPPSRPSFLHSFPYLFAFCLLPFGFFQKEKGFKPKCSCEKPKAKREGKEERKEGREGRWKEGKEERQKEGGDEGDKSWWPFQQRTDIIANNSKKYRNTASI